MDSVKKSCETCYWGSGKFVDAAHTVCQACDHQSSIYDPFPEWISNFVEEPDGALTYNVKPQDDVVNHPKHYTVHPSGVECIQITEHMNFCLGNAMKYIWRAGDKHETPLEDLKKARWYIDREIQRLENNEKV